MLYFLIFVKCHLLSFVTQRKRCTIPDIVLKLLDTHAGAKVHAGGKLSRQFCTSSGLRHRCILAAALFCIAIDGILAPQADTVLCASPTLTML